jgi:hypothetical protein
MNSTAIGKPTNSGYTYHNCYEDKKDNTQAPRTGVVALVYTVGCIYFEPNTHFVPDCPVVEPSCIPAG